MKINPDGKLKHLVAPDMFDETKRQVFSALTGEYLGTVKEGEESLLTASTDKETAITPQNNPNQLNLFL